MFANALLLSTSKMPTCWIFFFQKEKEKKKEEKKKERESEKPSKQLAVEKVGIVYLIFSGYLKIICITHVQAFGKNEVFSVCIYVSAYVRVYIFVHV